MITLSKKLQKTNNLELSKVWNQKSYPPFFFPFWKKTQLNLFRYFLKT